MWDLPPLLKAYIPPPCTIHPGSSPASVRVTIHTTLPHPHTRPPSHCLSLSSCAHALELHENPPPTRPCYPALHPLPGDTIGTAPLAVPPPSSLLRHSESIEMLKHVPYHGPTPRNPPLHTRPPPHIPLFAAPFSGAPSLSHPYSPTSLAPFASSTSDEDLNARARVPSLLTHTALSAAGQHACLPSPFPTHHTRLPLGPSPPEPSLTHSLSLALSHTGVVWSLYLRTS